MFSGFILLDSMTSPGNLLARNLGIHLKLATSSEKSENSPARFKNSLARTRIHTLAIDYVFSNSVPPQLVERTGYEKRPVFFVIGFCSLSLFLVGQIQKVLKSITSKNI